MLEKINNYINDNDFRLTIYDNKIHLINFKRIISIENNYISIKTDNKKIIIKGEKLVLKKILENEMFLIGEIENIEVKND